MTTYLPNIPNATDNVSASQAQLKGNFQELNSQFSIDHTAFNTGSLNGDGFHKKITFNTNLVDPSPISPQLVEYTKQVTINSVANTELFRTNSAQVMQIGGPFVAASTGSCTLFGGIILQWAQTQFMGLVTKDIVFNVPLVSTAYAVFCTGIGHGSPIWVQSVTNMGFTAVTGTAGVDHFYWVAIGK